MRACIVVPCFNHSATLADVVRGAHAHGPVVVVDDGSTEPLPDLPDATVLRLEPNRGKGAALRAGFKYALERGYTHAVTLDADGQLFPGDIPKLLDAARARPDALVLGTRDFVASGAPAVRRRTNLFSNFWVRIETGLRLGDTQCGFRCYPLPMSAELRTRGGRYAFELEILVRAAWAGLPIVTVPVRCDYAAEHVRRSHFRPLADTLRVSATHMRLTLMACLIPASLRRLWARGARSSVGRALAEFFTEHAGTPGALALAIGLGLFCGIAPLWGFQMLAAVTLAHLCGLNKAIALLASNISIPPLAPFILYAGLALGHRLLTGQPLHLSELVSPQAAVHRYFWEWLFGSVVLACATALLGALASYTVALRLRRRPRRRS